MPKFDEIRRNSPKNTENLEYWMKLAEKQHKLLEFAADRLVHVYGESPNLDYIRNMYAAYPDVFDEHDL